MPSKWAINVFNSCSTYEFKFLYFNIKWSLNNFSFLILYLLFFYCFVFTKIERKFITSLFDSHVIDLISTIVFLFDVVSCFRRSILFFCVIISSTCTSGCLHIDVIFFSVSNVLRKYTKIFIFVNWSYQYEVSTFVTIHQLLVFQDCYTP